MTRNRWIVALLVLALAAAACGGDDDDDDAGGDTGGESTAANTLSVEEVDYGYEFSGEVEAGTVTFAMENAGKEFHMMATCRLQDGKTVTDVADAAQSEDESAFGEVCVEGDPIDQAGGGQTPGSAYEVTVKGIEAGEYAALCFLPDAEGKPHFLSGMVGSFEVAEGDATEEPEADVTFTSTKDEAKGPEELEAGRTTIQVDVEDGAPDEVTLVKIKDGKKPADVDEYFKLLDEGGFYDQDESPAEFVFFQFDSTETRWFTVDLTEGQWGMGLEDSDGDEEDVPAEEDPHLVLFEVS